MQEVTNYTPPTIIGGLRIHL